MHARLLLPALLLCLARPLSLQAEIVIAAPGTVTAPIVIPKDATPSTRLAVGELADCIGKMSGTKPEIIQGEPQNIPQAAIWVGVQPKLKELFPGTNFDFRQPEEILIAAGEKHLVIAGRDRWDPEHPTRAFIKACPMCRWSAWWPVSATP